ncbi:MAG: deoxyribonuclease IV, partial [Lachnospiraceae bacterium]|nr:deoxyribonuclease IV [Lachnospiraceae bacterium]
IIESNGFAPLVAHAPYTLNLCSEKEDIREFAFNTMKDDLKRMEYLPGNYYNFHPGSHRDQGSEKGIELISTALRELLKEAVHTTVLLETMAGKGTEVGRDFYELKAILDETAEPEKTGICFDTCHVFDGGYDIKEGLEKVLEEFDSIIGTDRIKAVHINDTKNPMGSHKDRHEKIGQGALGIEALGRVVRCDSFKGLPFILETPNELEGYAEEIRILREIAG